MNFITYEQDGFVGVITINRPKALNALNSDVLKELDACLDGINLETTRALILTGAGEKSFVAGADIGEMSTLTKAEGEAFGKIGNDVFRKLETFPIPVIAAINGFALGGGCEISMSCDIRICSENAVFGQPEVGLGITPGFGGTQRLARIIGIGKAKEMIYAATNVKAEEAYRIGLVNAVYPLEELMPAAKKLAVISCKMLSVILQNINTEERPRLTNRFENRLLIGINAPQIQSNCIIWAETSHLSVMVITMNSLDTMLRPNMAGKEINAVKRSILRNTAT